MKISRFKSPPPKVILPLAFLLFSCLLMSSTLADEDLLRRLADHNGQVLVDASYFIDNPGHGDDQGGGGDPPPPSGRTLLELEEPFLVGGDEGLYFELSEPDVVADGVRMRIEVQFPQNLSLAKKSGYTLGYLHFDRPVTPQRTGHRQRNIFLEDWGHVPLYALIKTDAQGRPWFRVVTRADDVPSGDVSARQQTLITADLAGMTWNLELRWDDSGAISGFFASADGATRHEIDFTGPSGGGVLGELRLQLGNPDKGDIHDKPWPDDVRIRKAVVYDAPAAAVDLVVAGLGLSIDPSAEVSGMVKVNWTEVHQDLYQRLDPCRLAPSICQRPVAADAIVPKGWERRADVWLTALEIARSAPRRIVERSSAGGLRHVNGWGGAEVAAIFGDVAGRGVMPKPGQPYLWPGLECVGSVCDLRRQLKAEVEGVARLTPKGADLERAGIAGLGVWIDAIGNGRARANRRWMVRHALPAVADGGRSASALRGDLVRWRKLRVSLEARQDAQK